MTAVTNNVKTLWIKQENKIELQSLVVPWGSNFLDRIFLVQISNF